MLLNILFKKCREKELYDIYMQYFIVKFIEFVFSWDIASWYKGASLKNHMHIFCFKHVSSKLRWLSITTIINFYKFDKHCILIMFQFAGHYLFIKFCILFMLKYRFCSLEQLLTCIISIKRK